ncbi:MAG: type II toxin-antitoxin system RelE/ParE family toxin [Pirellulaceae bacterium]|nr:type II toxin-antitoxin system RelE/ParE family toxin [Pirellulaceae bacterium]
MNLIYHRSVQDDVSAVLNYYDEVSGPALGDAFFEEFMVYVALAVEHPTRFHPIDGDLRRANPDRFPYHFLYRIHGDTVRILVVRHHQRDPRHGLKRR